MRDFDALRCACVCWSLAWCEGANLGVCVCVCDSVCVIRVISTYSNGAVQIWVCLELAESFMVLQNGVFGEPTLSSAA